MIGAVSESSLPLVWTKLGGRGIMLKLARVDPVPGVLRSRGERWWGVAKLPPCVGSGLLAAPLVVDIVLGLPPLVFIVAVSVLTQRLPDAMSEGLGSVGAPLVVSAAAQVGQQLPAPYRTYGHEVVVRRAHGRGSTYAELFDLQARV